MAIYKTSDLDTTPAEQPILVNTEETIEWKMSIDDVVHSIVVNITGDAVIAASDGIGESRMFVQYVAAAENHGVVGTYYNEGKTTGDVVMTTLITNQSYTHNGKTVYYKYAYVGAWHDVTVIKPASIIVNTYPVTYLNYAQIAWTMIYGETVTPKKILVPVQWKTKYRSDPYQTQFGIEVFR